jgi:hypothetical protein
LKSDQAAGRRGVRITRLYPLRRRAVDSGDTVEQGNELRLTPGIGVEMPSDFHRLDRHLLPPPALLRR